MNSEIFSNNKEFNDNYEKIKKNYKTSKYLTKYEKTKILSERTQQLANGSEYYIDDISKFNNIYEIAYEELRQKKIPFIIKRPIGNSFEYWKLKDLEDF